MPAASPRPLRDLVEDRRDDIKAIVRAHHGLAVAVFGSAARDELRPDSDVDIFIDYDPAGPFSFVELLDLQCMLSGWLGRNVDFTTRGGLLSRLRARIEASSLRVF